MVRTNYSTVAFYFYLLYKHFHHISGDFRKALICLSAASHFRVASKARSSCKTCSFTCFSSCFKKFISSVYFPFQIFVIFPIQQAACKVEKQLFHLCVLIFPLDTKGSQFITRFFWKCIVSGAFCSSCAIVSASMHALTMFCSAFITAVIRGLLPNGMATAMQAVRGYIIPHT